MSTNIKNSKNRKSLKNEIFLKSSKPLSKYKNKIENLLSKGIKKITIFTLKNSFSKALILSQKLRKNFTIKFFDIKILKNLNSSAFKENSKIYEKTLIQIKLLFDLDK